MLHGQAADTMSQTIRKPGQPCKGTARTKDHFTTLRASEKESHVRITHEGEIYSRGT